MTKKLVLMTGTLLLSGCFAYAQAGGAGQERAAGATQYRRGSHNWRYGPDRHDRCGGYRHGRHSRLGDRPGWHHGRSRHGHGWNSRLGERPGRNRAYRRHYAVDDRHYGRNDDYAAVNHRNLALDHHS